MYKKNSRASLDHLEQMLYRWIGCPVVEKSDAFFMIGECNAKQILKLNLFTKLILFTPSLPLEIEQIKVNREEIRREMIFVIDGLRGTEPTMNIPYKSFHIMARERIKLLKQPIEECVELVIKELSNAIQICTRSVSVYSVYCI